MMSGSERSRSRSQSPTLTNQSTNSKASRRRSRSPSEKSYSDESFYSEAPRKNTKGKNNKPPPKGPNKKGSKASSKDMSRRSSTNGGANARSNPSTVTRIMSANRLRIQELRNRTAELTDQCVILQQENRDLKQLMHKQERKLNGYEQQENGMPRIMQRQADETQMLREQLRREKERGEKKSKKLNEKEDELEAMRRLVKKMQGLVEDKKLMERKKLSAKLKETEDKLHKEQEKNATLERHVQNLSKNHKHQLSTERTKEQELERQIEKLQEKYDKLEIDMKEKEKERTLQNIYSLRSMRPPHRLESSLQSNSQTDLARTSKPRPDGRERARVERRRVGGSGDLTTRRDDYSPKKSDRRYEDSSIQSSHGDDYGYRESQASVYKTEDKRDKERDTPRDKERDTQRNKEEDTARDRERESDITEDPLSWLRQEKAREQERRNWLEAKEKEDAKKKEEERRREEARRREEERQREEEEEEEKRKEQEQKRRTEHYEQPTRYQHQEQNHFDDRNNNKNDPETPKKIKKDEEEDRFVKDDLLAKLRAIDDGKPDRISSSTRKEYNFTEPVNNLHQGLPAHGQRKSNIFGDESPTFGSYQPSFMLSDSKTTKTRDSKTSIKPELGNKNKQSDLFAELFANEPKRASNVLTDARQDSPVLLELGGLTTKAKPHPTQLHREKQANVPVFRSTTKKIEFSDEEIEDIQEL